MHTQRFQKHDKNELLYLRGDDIALMTSSCTKNRIFAEKNVLETVPRLVPTKVVADLVPMIQQHIITSSKMTAHYLTPMAIFLCVSHSTTKQ